MSEEESEPRASWLRLLLLLPVIAMLWVPSYNKIDPVILGLPFFYSYQLIWVLLASVVIGVVYRAEH
jgi:hypothetical protein